MDFLPPDFADIPYGSVVAAACAPHVGDPGFNGIAIRAPDQVRASGPEQVRLPICGYYQLGAPQVLTHKEMHVHIKALGVAASHPMTGLVIEGTDIPRVPAPDAKEPIDLSRYQGQVAESYFYLDGQRYLPARLAPGTYELFVSYGGAHSNMVRVTIIRK